MLKDNLIKTLYKIKKNNNLQLFHQSCTNITYLSEITKNDPEAMKWLTSESNPNHNQLIIDNLYSTYPDDGTYDVLMDKLFALTKPIEKRDNDLKNLLNKIVDTINSDKSHKKYMKLLKDFFNDPLAIKLLYDYVHHQITVRFNSDKPIKFTSACKELGDVMIQFIIIQNSQCKVIFKYFDYESYIKLKDKDKIFINSLIEILFKQEISEKEIITFFTKHSFVNSTFYTYVYNYMKNLFIKEYKKNTIFDDQIKKIIEESLRIFDDISLKNDINREQIALGHYLLDIMLEHKLFKITYMISAKDPNTKYIEPENDILNFIFKTKWYEKPMLSENQITLEYKMKEENFNILLNNMSKNVHENPRINLEFQPKSYVRKKRLYTKLSINRDYLAIFLATINDGLTEDEILSLYNIEPIKIQKLRELNNSMVNKVITSLLCEAQNFSRVLTPSKIQEDLTSKLKMIEEAISNKQADRKTQNDISLKNDVFIENNSSNDVTYNVWDIENLRNEFNSFLPYKTHIKDLINKIASRKYQLVELIIQSIDYSIYKYFIHTSYYDSRGRTYLAAKTLNILSNPLAKMLVSIYDVNEGNYPSHKCLKIIKSCLTFNQTKDKIIPKIEEDIIDEHIEKIYMYINSYLNLKSEDLKKLIKNQSFIGNQRKLLNYIKPIIKKYKKLFYVHSLIVYEQFRYWDLHDKTIINYIQKDASSSGFQVMAAFFRDPQLAQISNLIGKENYDLYTKSSLYCYDLYKKTYEFAMRALKWFGLDAMNFINESELKIDFCNYKLEDYDLLKLMPQKNMSYIIYLIRINFETSVITRKFLESLTHHIKNMMLTQEAFDVSICSFLLPFLPVSDTKLMQNLSEMNNFNGLKPILEFVFCLRLAIRIVYIAERIIQIPHNEPTLWTSKELNKQSVMTTLYGSTSFGRKNTYIKLFSETYMIPQASKWSLHELASFIDIGNSEFLAKNTNLSTLDDFADEICSDKKIIIKNRNFKITLEPKITHDFQVSCSSFSKKRASQLVMKKITNVIDERKLRSMFMANLAHSMDSDIMHHFTALCLNINKQLENANSSYRICFERNHDCFILNYAPLLEIIVEEAYLRFCQQDNINNLVGLSNEQISKYTKKSIKEFMSLLDPINPYFIK